MILIRWSFLPTVQSVYMSRTRNNLKTCMGAELEREREARQNIEARFEQFQQECEKERADQDAWRKNMEEMVKNIGKK
ncbi:hypothetical protein HanRHA438_Chr08g0362041 [Helianthus annuus]|uniref:Uncharacterized protein n=1 Tax=Helianthus annuus TaxID=4232 RepID=A0A9K3JWS2_HELAN|nr:hypothetical protein HanXRQr2_Chr01g0021141 [Helianthus annuus]KAJ0622638.1 hypothetical protein HanIR_Chr01g0022861 [Helianthus annuus]KAJ0626881.1 hypothetical protein HanHA89_Chr01g0018981 [Helianthus annuus]KAJ0719964.1 hypothetical protein HanLR1_Chr08g0287701 [Helianthus annuus]KAJ0723189.1 hypothetical protein HanOQP8_Chr08g0295181 [Helianthus annuus]